MSRLLQLVPLHLAVVSACTGTVPKESPADSPQESSINPDDSQESTPDDSIPPDDSTPLPESGLIGVLVDAAGLPLANTDLYACTSATCLKGETEADGSFYFDIASPAMIALKTHEELDSTPRKAAALEPCYFVDLPAINVGTLYVPDLPEGVEPESEERQSFSVGDGLELTLSWGEITPALGDFLNDLAATRLPDPYLPYFHEIDTEAVVAVYALHPFAATSDSPIAVRAPSTLAAGTEVKFRTISELDGTFSEAVIGHSDGSYVSTDPGLGIDRLTYLVISY